MEHSIEDLPKSASLGLESIVSRRQLREKRDDQKLGRQWTVDGRPLSRILREEVDELPNIGRELQTDLYFSVVQDGRESYRDAGQRALGILLGETVWDDLPGRVPLFVGECLDIPCGVITACIERLDGIIVWSDFMVHGAGPDEHGYPYDRSLIFTFGRRQHDSTLRRVVARL